MITVADHGATKSFLRDGRIVVQANLTETGALVIGFVDRTLVPRWPSIPTWYPCEAAVADAISHAS